MLLLNMAKCVPLENKNISGDCAYMCLRSHRFVCG